MDPVNETATGSPMQDISERIEGVLYEEDTVDGPEQNDDVVPQDDTNLPNGNDADSEGDKGSDESNDLSLAGYLGIDEDRIVVGEDDSVSVNMIIDGKTKPVPMKDLVSSYQLQGHVNNTSIALSEERKEFEGQRSQAALELKERLEGVSGLAKVSEQELIREYQSIDWERLKHEDPSQWSVARQEYADRAHRIQQTQQLLQEEGRRQLEQHQKVFHEQQVKIMDVQVAKMIEDNPSWTDPTVMKQEQEGIRTFLSDIYGFTDEDMSQVRDSRVLRMIKDAKAYRTGQVNAKAKMNQTNPKFAKPTVTRTQASKQTQKARNVKARKTALRKSGSTQDAANLLLDRM